MGRTGKKPRQTPKEAGTPNSRLAPLEYHAVVRLGRGCGTSEISKRLDIPPDRVWWLLCSAVDQTGCGTLEELREMFEPDWARLDAPVPESRYEKVNGRIVLRGGEAKREAARRKYALNSLTSLEKRLREERAK